MALFLRGNVWWFEYRTSKVRVVKTTGFRKDERAKAQAAFDAFRLGMGAKPVRSAMEKMLEAIYSTGEAIVRGVPLSSVWAIYNDWFTGKGRRVADSTFANRRNEVGRFVEWAVGRGLAEVGEVSVEVARAYVRSIAAGRSNKTVRNITQHLQCVWDALGQLRPDVHNPWKAACPDADGSAETGSPFSPTQEEAVFKAAAAAGHDWLLACTIARWTGQRYGDVALLDWSQVDFKARTIAFTPSKTARHALRIVIPMADALEAALAAVPGSREGYVLPGHAMAYLAKRKMPVQFAAILRGAKLSPSDFTFHSWRHTFRTRLAEAGVSDAVAARFGWSNLRMSAHYDHASHLEEMREAVGLVSSRKTCARV